MSHNLDPMVWPILTQIGLTLFVIFLLGFQRVSQIRKRGILAIRETGFIGRVEQTSANLKHQFETPVLFYVIALLFVALAGTTSEALVLAWIYVGLRIIHAAIQLTHDTIFPWRFGTFVFSMLALLGLYGVAIMQVLSL